MKTSILVSIKDPISSAPILDYFNRLALRREDQRITLLHVWRKPSASEELMGKKFWRISPRKQPDDQISKDAAVDKIERTLTGHSQRFEWTCQQKSGERIDTEITLTKISMDNQSLILAIIHDMSHRKHIEETLESMVGEWRITLDAMTDSVSLLDMSCNIIRTNKATSQLLNLSFKKILGHNCYELFHGKMSRPKNCPFRKMLESRKTETEEFYLSHLQKWVSIIVSPILDSNNKLKRPLQKEERLAASLCW